MGYRSATSDLDTDTANEGERSLWGAGSSFTISIESSVRKRLNLPKTKKSTPPINTMTLQSNPPPGAGLYPGLTCYTAGRVGELIDSCDLFFTRDHETCH